MGIIQDFGFFYVCVFNLVIIGFNEIVSLSGCMFIVIVNDIKLEYILVVVVGMVFFDNLFCGKVQWLGYVIFLSI